MHPDSTVQSVLNVCWPISIYLRWVSISWGPVKTYGATTVTGLTSSFVLSAVVNCVLIKMSDPKTPH